MTTNLTQRSILRRKRRRGFTLTEIAIVLGIVGLILGAIWAAASAVYENLKFSQAQQGITLSAQQVRSLFASSNTTGVPAGSPASILAPGMLPVSWTNSGNPGNPWNQAPAGALTYIYGDGSKFQIELDNIDPAGCSSLLNFYNAAASAVNGGLIVGLVASAGNGSVATPGTASIGAAVTASGTYAVPATACVGGTQSNNVAITFDISNM